MHQQTLPAAAGPRPRRPAAAWALALLALGLLLSACGGGGGTGPGAGTVVVDAPPVGGGGGGTAPELPASTQVRRVTAELRAGRYAHSATLLADGRVLVAGGTLQGTSLAASAEIYSPALDGFALVPAPLRFPRSNHTATRLADGRVLLCGGWVETSVGVLQAQDRAEVFDPDSGSFTEVGRMRQARVDHAAVLLPDGRVLVTGGSVLNGSFLADLASAELFDPATGTFTAHPTGMAHTHATHACLEVGPGRYAVVGGSDADLRAEIYDAASSTFSPLPVAPGDAPRYNACAATFATGAAVFGGGDAQGTVMHVRADGAGVSSTGSALSRPRHYATATRIASDQVLVVGGVDFTAQQGLLLTSADLIVAGGLSGASTYATPLRFPVPLAAHTATRLLDGRVLYCGGLTGDDQQSGRRDAFVFTP